MSGENELVFLYGVPSTIIIPQWYLRSALGVNSHPWVHLEGFDNNQNMMTGHIFGGCVCLYVLYMCRLPSLYKMLTLDAIESKCMSPNSFF